MAVLALTVVSKTPTLIRLSWTPPLGAIGYIYLRDGLRIANTWNGAVKTVSLGIPDSKPHTYVVEAITVGSVGSITVNPLPPPPVTGSSHELGAQDFGVETFGE